VGAPPRHGRAYVVGVARSVQLRPGENDNQVLSFRVDQYDAAGNRVQPVGVELQWYRGGQLSEGEEVRVEGHWRRGTLIADEIVNLTTGAHVKGAGWVRSLMVALSVLMGLGIVAFIAWIVLSSV
jgi:hypothetical protein